MNPWIQLANPKALVMTLIFLAFVWVFHFIASFHRKRISSWIDVSLWKTIIPDFSNKTVKLKSIFLTLTVLSLGLALSRPQWGETEEVINTQGMDIVFLLDLSNSMLAEDTSPSRLARAQTFIKKTLTQIENDRVGVVGFAGSAQLAIPLTTDFQYVAEVVDTLDPTAVQNQGTNIGDAIDAAMKSLERSGEDQHKNSRAMILITDGEDFGEAAMASAKKIKDFGTGFFAIAVGTTDGAPIPIRNDSGVLQTYKKDSSGKTVMSRVNKDLLAKVADEAGGKFFELINPDDASYTVAKELKRFNRGALQEQRVITKIERFEWFLVAGILFLLLYLGSGYRRARLIFAFFLMFQISAQASDTDSIKSFLQGREGVSQFKDKKFEDSAKTFEEALKHDADNPEYHYNEGTALGNGGKTEEAVPQLQAATQKALTEGDFGTAAKSLFNEGIAQEQLKNMPEAYDRLTKAIEMAKISNQPEIEKKAREELTRMAIKQKQEQEKKKKDGDKDQDKNGKQDQNQDKSGGSGQDKDDQQKKDGDQNKDDQQKGMNAKSVKKKQEFRSGTLSKDTAESIMNDLSDREKQLYHNRLKDKKRREQSNGNDW